MFKNFFVNIGPNLASKFFFDSYEFRGLSHSCHSSSLADAFSLPPTDGAEVIDGCSTILESIIHKRSYDFSWSL